MLKATAIGHLGNDCAVNNVNGNNVINFNVAHSEKFKDAQGVQKERTTWIQCAYWTDKTAVAAYLKKGTQVYVEGQPDVKSFPKNDGTTGVSLTLRVFQIQLLGSAPAAQPAQPVYQPAPAPASVPQQYAKEDLPF